MVAWFQGPLILQNRRFVDTFGLVVEFDAEIRVKLSRDTIKAKLRFEDVHRYGFVFGNHPAFVIIHVSTGNFMRFSF
jgi:hypothetical protein